MLFSTKKENSHQPRMLPERRGGKDESKHLDFGVKCQLCTIAFGDQKENAMTLSLSREWQKGSCYAGSNNGP